MALQAAQVRKSNYVPEKGVDYDPDKHSVCTVYQGTIIQQVASRLPPLLTSLRSMLLGLQACCMQYRHIVYCLPAFWPVRA